MQWKSVLKIIVLKNVIKNVLKNEKSVLKIIVLKIQTISY